MEIKLAHNEGFILAQTVGTIDETAADLLDAHLHPLVGQRGTKIVLDVSQSTRMTSSGLAHLVKLVCDAHTNSSRVVLAGPTPFVTNVLAVTKLASFFETAESVPRAAEMLAE